jgi:hypothetical protein
MEDQDRWHLPPTFLGEVDDVRPERLLARLSDAAAGDRRRRRRCGRRPVSAHDRPGWRSLDA